MKLFYTPESKLLCFYLRKKSKITVKTAAACDADTAKTFTRILRSPLFTAYQKAVSIGCMTQIKTETIIASDGYTAPLNGILKKEQKQQAQSECVIFVAAARFL